MTGFDLLGQTYLMCTVFGWSFIVFTLMMGHFGHDGSDGGDGHSIQSDSSGGEAGIGSHAQGVLDAAHGIHHLDGGSVDGMHIAHGHSGLTGGHHTADGHSGHDGDGDGDNSGARRKFGDKPRPRAQPEKPLLHSTEYFQPNVDLYLHWFLCVTGIAVRSALPWMGPFTLIPAMLAGLVATNIMKAVLAWATRKLSASSLISVQQAIGQIAEVNTPIKEGRLGEVSYVIGLTRFNSAARPAKEGCEIARGAKVIIVETDGSVVLVEPFSDSQLDGH
jgi:hypothetical protein